MPDPCRYAIYARVSERGSTQREHETSLPDQVDRCRRWLAARGLQPACIVQDEFESGATLQRPGIQRLIADLDAPDACPWDAIILYRLNRLSRSVCDAAPLFRRLLAAGRGIVSVLEDLDFSSPMGRLQIHVLLAVSEWQRDTLAEDTRNRMVAIASRGLWPVGRCPLGYRRRGAHDNVLVPDPEQAPVVRAMFRDYLAGVSVTELTRRHRGTARGSNSSVCDLLRNPVYRGRIRYAGAEYPGQHEPLIDAATFDAVQQRLPGARPHAPRWSAHRRANLLTGLLHCHCGLPMTSKWTAKTSGARYDYYVCPRRGCRPGVVQADRLERFVLEQLRDAPLDAAQVAAIAAANRRRRESAQRDAAPELAQLDSAIAAADRRAAHLQAAFASGLVTAANAAAINADLAAATAAAADHRRRRADLAAAAAAGCSPYEQADQLIRALRTIGQLLDAVAADIPATRAVLRRVLARIVRLPDDSYDFLLRLPLQPATPATLATSTPAQLHQSPALVSPHGPTATWRTSHFGRTVA